MLLHKFMKKRKIYDIRQSGTTCDLSSQPDLTPKFSKWVSADFPDIGKKVLASWSSQIMLAKENPHKLSQKSSQAACHLVTTCAYSIYILKVKRSVDFALQSKKNLRKKRINLDAKMLR